VLLGADLETATSSNLSNYLKNKMKVVSKRPYPIFGFKGLRNYKSALKTVSGVEPNVKLSSRLFARLSMCKQQTYKKGSHILQKSGSFTWYDCLVLPK